MGEEFVVRLERHRLLLAGRDDLARKVLWVAVEIGDGLGFDVLSFDDLDGSEKLIEVKTTGLGKYFPFYVSSTEVRCSEDMADRFHLFRVFDFARSPRVYILTGPLRAVCRLEPVQYRATI
jgi:Protein NO VEIN, C-terminal